MRRAGSMSKGRRNWRQSRLLLVALITAAIAATYTLISWVHSSSFTQEELAARTRAVAKDNMQERTCMLHMSIRTACMHRAMYVGFDKGVVRPLPRAGNDVISTASNFGARCSFIKGCLR